MSSVRATPIRVPVIAVSIICCALLACAFLSATQQAAPPEAKLPGLPTLRGEEAVKRLKQDKQDGSYQSLAEAINAVTQQAQLFASDGAGADRFGRAVAISGDTVVVGADLDNIGATSDQGSAYVFVRSGTTWVEQQKLTASDGAAGDFFGISVAISGETIVLGAFGHGISNAYSDTDSESNTIPYARSNTDSNKYAAIHPDELHGWGERRQPRHYGQPFG